MGRINYKKIYDRNREGWKDLTDNPEKYEALLAGHYSDSNHFIYELIQNAEDAGASKIVFEYHDDKLVFFHNGKPFDELDVKGVSSMLMGTKDKEDGQTIGRFGMGFKSVFKYTCQPEIYSDEEAFKIEKYLLPVELEDVWDHIEEKQTLVYSTSFGEYKPFCEEQHLTKIIIPFIKKDENGNLLEVDGHDVLRKLEDIESEILLFLTHIKSLFWTNGVGDRYALISVDESQSDKNELTCRIEGTRYGEKEEISKFLKFGKKFDHPNMRFAEVSIAYKLNNRIYNINEMQNTNVWVYFPTKDSTSVPFLVHGSFETAVSREKLMEPSKFNNDLYEVLENVICESLLELKERKLITQNFIRKILFPAFKELRLAKLKQKVTNLFQREALLPDREGIYQNTNSLVMAVPLAIAEFRNVPFLQDSLMKKKYFVALTNEKESYFTEFFNWLKEELSLEVFDLKKWSEGLLNLKDFYIDLNDESTLKSLNDFYGFLSDNRESVYERQSKYSWSRGGPYETLVRDSLEETWNILRQAPVILNEQGVLCKSFDGEHPNIYLNSSSHYKSIDSSSIVLDDIAKEFKLLLQDGFQITEFDNFQYVKEKVIRKYINVDNTVWMKNDATFNEEYLSDIKQIVALIEENNSVSKIQELLEEAIIIRVIDGEGVYRLIEPRYAYQKTSLEGVNLEQYFQNIEVDLRLIDELFYIDNNISLSVIERFGLFNKLVTDGEKSGKDLRTRIYWEALDSFCPNIQIYALDKNLKHIERNKLTQLSYEKSVGILRLLLQTSRQLSGIMKHRKTQSYEEPAESKLLIKTIKVHSWLFDKRRELLSPVGISKFDLDQAIYGPVIDDKEAYSILGFIETDKDNREETFNMVESLDQRDKSILVKQLARELGYKLESDITETSITEGFDDDSTFSVEDYISRELPFREVKNWDNLIEHVRQAFFCSDPIKYEKVLRQIRTSKNAQISRAYIIGMYTNNENVKICQMCKEPTFSPEAVEIANYGIEMNQLHLCLCSNCASKYRMIRDNNKGIFAQQIKQDIERLNATDRSKECEVELNTETFIYFTHTHTAELQEIFKLLDQYGIPETANDEIANYINFKKDNTFYSSASKIDTLAGSIIKGSFVTYKALDGGNVKQIVIDYDKYPAQRVFIGKQIGDRIDFSGKEHEIMEFL